MKLKDFCNFFPKLLKNQTITKHVPKIPAENQQNLAFLSNFFKNWKKMLPNSRFCPKNVAKNPNFYVVKKPTKLKKLLKSGVAKIEGFQNRDSTVFCCIENSEKERKRNAKRNAFLKFEERPMPWESPIQKKSQL